MPARSLDIRQLPIAQTSLRAARSTPDEGVRGYTFTVRVGADASSAPSAASAYSLDLRPQS